MAEAERIVYADGCPVCGWPEALEDWDICPSCGFEACGQEDWPNGQNWPILRQEWIDGGMNFWSVETGLPPKDWNPREQLSKLDERIRKANT